MSSFSNGVPGAACSDSANNSDDRSTPTIESSLISIRRTPNAGFGAFADKDLEPHTELLRSSSPVAYVIYRQFRKEVCAWCFRYEQGRTWKVRLSESDLILTQEGDAVVSLEEGASAKTDFPQKSRAVSGSTNGGGMVFDSESCRDSWVEEYGVVGLECFAAVEAFVQRQSRKKVEKEENGESDSDSKLPPTPEEIDLVSTSTYFQDRMHFSGEIALLKSMSRLGELFKRRFRKSGINDYFLDRKNPQLRQEIQDCSHYPFPITENKIQRFGKMARALSPMCFNSLF